MTRRRMRSTHRWLSRHPKLGVAMFTVGALLALVEPAAARIGANHNETLLSN